MKEYPNIELLGSKDESQYRLKLSDKKIIEINLFSDPQPPPASPEEEENDETPAKRQKLDNAAKA